MQPQATGAVGQITEGEGREPEHTHPPRTHTHDHYHVSHHHTNNPLNEWEHRSYWRTRACWRNGPHRPERSRWSYGRDG